MATYQKITFWQNKIYGGSSPSNNKIKFLVKYILLQKNYSYKICCQTNTIKLFYL